MKNTLYVLLSIGLVILSWGGYGTLLRVAGDKTGHSALIPFMFVGLAYFVVGVVAAWAWLAWRGEPGNWTVTGVFWSTFAGTVTAVGALGVNLAIAAGGSPIYIMPLIFGGAPVVNTMLSMWMSKTHKEAGAPFYSGLILVIAGAAAVLFFNPAGRGPSGEISFAAMLTVLAFVALTAICWGAYGPLLHKGQMRMHNSRMRPFICVGLAYAVVALVALGMRFVVIDKGFLSFSGAVWSFGGGVAGALGSLGVILAFTFGGKPVYVMPLVFGGAPVVNTLISVATATSLREMSPIQWGFFYAGLIVVVAGAVTVLLFAPKGQPHAAPVPAPAPTPAPAPAPAEAKI
jgi:hypothetical protein